MNRPKAKGKPLVLTTVTAPNVTASMTNLEFLQVLEDVFDTPSPLMADLLRRFENMATKESGEGQIEGQDVPIQLNCPVCGSTLDLTLE